MKRKRQLKTQPPRTMTEALKRWGVNYSLFAPGAEGLRFRRDQNVANERAAGLARMYIDS